MKDANHLTEIPLGARLFQGILIVFVIGMNSFISISILRKNWSDLKPMNVFVANYFSGLALLGLPSFILTILPSDHEDVGKICPEEIFRYIFGIIHISNIYLLQIDRLVAISCPYFYNEKFNTKMSVWILILSKVMATLLAVVVNVIDPIFLLCPSCGLCRYTRPINLYTTSYPALFALVLTISVSLYILNLLFQQER